MVFRIDKTERNIILLVLAILTIWFTFGLDVFTAWAKGREIVAYSVFLVIYGALILRLVFGVNPFKNVKLVAAIFLVFLVSDILIFPYLVPKNHPPEQSTEIQLSSDVYIYNLLPTTWAHEVRYYATYVVIPTLLLILAALLVGTARFTDLVKRSL